MGSFCLTEPDAGSDAAGCKTTAIWNGKEYILNGLKCFITNGPLADYYMVVALTNPELKTKGLTAFIVEREWEGVSIGKIEDKCGIRCAQVSEVIFDNVRVPKENMLGEEGKGFAVAMKDLDGGRIGVAAQGLGIATANPFPSSPSMFSFGTLTNPELKTKGLTAFIVEREWEGVSIGKIEDKCCIRTCIWFC